MVDEEPDKVVLSESYSIMVTQPNSIYQFTADCTKKGVDALNVALEVILFAATMNLGQGWKTILVLFGCRLKS